MEVQEFILYWKERVKKEPHLKNTNTLLNMILNQMAISLPQIPIKDRPSLAQEIYQKILSNEDIYFEIFSDNSEEIEIINRVIDDVRADLHEKVKRDSNLQQSNMFYKTISDILAEKLPFLPLDKRQYYATQIFNDIAGFGPIQPFIEDKEISEIMINRFDQVYIEKNGKLILTDVKFRDENHVRLLAERIVAPIGRRIDDSSPRVDARLPDGSRVNIVIPPIAMDGTCITIRKFKDALTVEKMIEFGTYTKEIADLLANLVKGAANIVVSGGTGSGKTSQLNALSSFIPFDERIVTIEDSAELQLKQPHVVRLEARPPNIEGKGAVTIQDLVKNALRMRPDRIVVGECRGGEALDMIQAMNTGHDGSLTTAHANSPADMLRRLEVMVLLAGHEIPIIAIREQIASAVDIIIQIARLQDGSRRLTQITEILECVDGKILTKDWFVLRKIGQEPNGRLITILEPTGEKPSEKILRKLDLHGVKLDLSLFEKNN